MKTTLPPQEGWHIKTSVTEKHGHIHSRHTLHYGKGKPHDSGHGPHELVRLKNVMQLMREKGCVPSGQQCRSDHGGEWPSAVQKRLRKEGR